MRAGDPFARLSLPGGDVRRDSRQGGFSLIELIIVIALIATLAAIAINVYADVTSEARVVKAIADVRILEDEIAAFELYNNRLPNSLAEIGRDTLMDPWGQGYQYLNFATVSGKGQMRKDRFLVPLNSTYDLYSRGKDGQSQAPITAKVSQDDILRANDGAYIGLAAQY